MLHPYHPTIAPSQGLPVDATVSPQSLRDVLAVLVEVTTLALRMFHYAAVTEANASAMRHVLNAEAETRNAQQVLMPVREEGPRVSKSPP